MTLGENILDGGGGLILVLSLIKLIGTYLVWVQLVAASNIGQT
jgi:hypothetical protein